MTVDKRLLIEATPELLDGWCGSVVFAGEGGPLVPGVVISRMHDGRYLCWSDQAGLEWVAHTDLRLDLARAECWDRVVRVLADRCTGEPQRVTYGPDGFVLVIEDFDTGEFRAELHTDGVVYVWSSGDHPWLAQVELGPDAAKLALAAVAREVLRG